MFINIITFFSHFAFQEDPEEGQRWQKGHKGGAQESKWCGGGNPKGAKSVLGKGFVDRYTFPRTTVGHCEDPQGSKGRQLHSLKALRDDSCTVWKAPKRTVAQFARPQRPKDDSCTVCKVPKTTVAQFARAQRRQLHRLQGPIETSRSILVGVLT